MPVLALFFLWPLVEIALFVTVGGALGLVLTLCVVLGTALLGLLILRRLGLRSTRNFRESFGDLRNPLKAAGSDVLMAMAAVLLLLPGFLTDALGLLLLLPWVREMVIAALLRHFVPVSMQSDQPARRSDGIVIDGDFTELDHDQTIGRPKKPSGWTQH